MNGTQLRDALSRGERLYSTLATVTNPKWSDAYAAMGLDFIFIDTEHIPLHAFQVSELCQRFRAMEIAPVVRIPDHDPNKACAVLDAGASGVLAPYVETPGQLKSLIGAVKYRPLKGLKLESFLNAEAPLEEKLLDYLTGRNKENSLFINIESVPAVDNLEELLSFPELDGIIIGPHDLSCSLGIPEEYEHPLFLETIERIIRLSCEHGKAVGYHKGYASGDSTQMIRWAEMGMNILIYEGDLISSASVLKGEIGRMRTALGDEAVSGDDKLTI